MPNPLLSSMMSAPFMRWLGRLSFPKLFAVFAVLFAADALMPDPIPFVDEILLGLGTLLFASWKDRKKR